MEKNNLVVKHNSLIRSRYDYTLAELRLVLTVVSMISPNDEDFLDYVVKAKDFSDLVDSSHKDEYKRLQELGEMLLSKTLKIPESDGFVICNWFSSFRYIKGEGTIIVRFDPILKPYLLQLQQMFTKYNLENILKFKSAYSIRIYEIAKSWETRGEFSSSIEEFKEIIGAANKYKAYYDFKRYVLERSLKEINSLSDIRLSYKEKKKGRKVIELKFKVRPNLPKEKNYLASLKTFIAYMRKNYVNQVIYEGQTATSKHRFFSISPEGRIYDMDTLKDLSADKSEAIWNFLYSMAKEGKLPILQQSTLKDYQ